MSKKISLFYWGICDVSLLKDLCTLLYQDDILKTCVCIPMGTSKIKGFDNDYFKVIESLSLDDNVIDSLQPNNRRPLDRNLMESMLPYESRAIELGMRRTNIPAVEYCREKQRYYRELRHINDIFEKYEINSFFAGAVPHYQDAYIAYCLAKIRNIPTKFFVPTVLPNRHIIADELGNVGKYISNRYEKIKREHLSLKINSKDLYDYYTTQSLPMDELRKLKNPGSDKETRIIQKRQTNHYWGIWSKRHQLIWNPFTRYLKRIKELKIQKDNSAWDKRHILLHNFIEEHALVNYYFKHYKFSIKKYNRFAKYPHYEKPFILFALQFVPEASTIPMAGTFSSQYVSIQLLAKCAEAFGCDVYVKEHGHLKMRNLHFYDEISLIPNVKFIKTTVSTYELMDKCIAVSSQTGSCLLEAILQGVPAIAMGNGYLWKSIPGLFEVNDFDSGTKALDTILNCNYEIDKNDVYSYMCAIDQETIIYKAHDNLTELERNKNFRITESIFRDLYKDITGGY